MSPAVIDKIPGTSRPHDLPCGDCTDLMRLMGRYCGAHDVPLRSNQNGAIRCSECIRDHSRQVEIND